MKRLVLFLFLFAFVPAMARGRQASGNSTVDGFTFKPTSNFKLETGTGFVTVIDAETKKTAGTIIVNGGGTIFSVFPQFDKAKVEAAYEKYLRGSSQPGKSDTANAPSSPAGPAQANAVDAASNTVTLPDGVKVTFIDKDNLTIFNWNGVTITAKHHGGGILKAINPTAGTGASLGGGGVEFRQGYQLVYDSGIGASTRQVLDTAKDLAQKIANAAALFKKQTGRDAISTNVINDLYKSRVTLVDKNAVP